MAGRGEACAVLCCAVPSRPAWESWLREVVASPSWVRKRLHSGWAALGPGGGGEDVQKARSTRLVGEAGLVCRHADRRDNVAELLAGSAREV